MSTNSQSGDYSTIINHKETNGNHSLVTLATNVVDAKVLTEWTEKLDGMTFYGGKTSFGDIPREQSWFYDDGGNFGDRVGWKDPDNPRWIARKYNETLLDIQQYVQGYVDTTVFSNDICADDTCAGVRRDVFNSILANKYRGGGDSIKPHRDSEIVFGNNPSVAILSIGCTREIIFERILYDEDRINSIKRDKSFDGEMSIKVTLTSGSVLFMGGEVQKYYSHEIKKVRNSDGDIDGGGGVRYSLTFRQY